MLGMLGDPLLTPALDASEVGLGEIDGHAGRLSVDIGEVAAQGRLRDCGLGGDPAELWPPPWKLSRVLDFLSGVGDEAADAPAAAPRSAA
jgi:hypothetical protein